MLPEGIFERYLEALLRGDRGQSRLVIEETLQKGNTANSVYVDVIWPTMVQIEKLIRSDTISPVREHMATRINRTIVDQLQNKLPRRPQKQKKVIVCCAQDELQELGAQMMADLFESGGWEVRFIGGGLNNDDILAFINEYGPDVLLIYGTAAKQAPQVRFLIDRIRDVNAWPSMRIMLSGGVFGRAEGLWQEVGADLFAGNPTEALRVASDERMPAAETATIDRRKKKRRRTAPSRAANVA